MIIIMCFSKMMTNESSEQLREKVSDSESLVSLRTLAAMQSGNKVAEQAA